MIKQEKSFKSGFVAVIGKPNVGKSTLINKLIGQKIAAVSPKPQTTRKTQLGILTTSDGQLIFVDTPGLHKPHHKLGELMNQNAMDVMDESDIILVIVDGSVPPKKDNDQFQLSSFIDRINIPKTVLAINKIDKVKEETLEVHENAYLELYPNTIPLKVSAVRGDNLDILLPLLFSLLPEGEPFYPVDQITDLYEREIAADLIRAACMIHLRKEIPHAVAIRIDQYLERGDHAVYMEATIFVERDSQKGIVIGRGGKMLKKIGMNARSEIEVMNGKNTFLQLRVKVRKNWRNDEKTLLRFGFSSTQ